ncbi:MAG: type II toxin-antitoxin system RelE/ParE family toxin [Candidatus Xenobiia bacterium LiM19]
MAEIRWSENALSDLDAIVNYISRDSVHYARLFATRIFMAVGRLREFPQSGRIAPEMSDEAIREIIYGSYRIIFRIMKESDQVEILTIHHGSMLPGSIEGLDLDDLP